MSGLSVDQIKTIANQAKTLYKSYIDNLVLGGEVRKASDNEINLFNLEAYYQDNKISAVEALDIKNRIDSIDIESLVNKKDIVYNTTEKKLRVIRTGVDLNNDGKTDLTDVAALSYVINFKGDNLSALENTLQIVGNPDKIADFYVQKWAQERGMATGTEQYNVFYNKFYNELYKNSNPRTDLSLLQKVLQFYDAGLGKENINEINTYLPAIKTDTTFGTIISLYKFANSESFDVPADQKQAKLASYINIFNSSNTDLKRVFAEALTRKYTPLTGKPLTTKNLDFVLEIYQIPQKDEREKSLNTIMFNQWADKKNLTEQKKEDFINKLLLYTDKKGLALGIGQLQTLTTIYDLNKESNPDFNINQLDAYAEAVRQNIPPKSILLIHKFEKSGNFNLTEPLRSAKLKEYFDILNSSNSDIKKFFLQALANQKIPFTEEPLNISSLNTFINKISQPDGIIDQVINNWADERNLTGQEKVTFFNKLKEFHSKKITQEQMKLLLGFYDEAQKNNKNFPLNNLDVYVKGLIREIKPKQLNSLFKFEISNNFSPVGGMRHSELENLVNVLTGGDKSEKDLRKQDILQKTLSNGQKVIMTNDDISLENIKKVFARIDDVANYGFENLQIENMARERNIQSPEKEVFISKIKEWYLPQTDSTKNLQLKLGNINSLVKLYDEKKLGLNDLDVYAKAIKDGISFKEISAIYKFETANDLKNKNSNRLEKIGNYLGILKSGNKAKSGAMLSSMRNGRMPISQKLLKEPSENYITEEKLTEFFEMLKKYDKERDLTIKHIEVWSEDPKFPSGFQAKFLSYYNDNQYKLTLADLRVLKKLYENDTSFDLNKLDFYAKGIKAKTSIKDLNLVYKIHNDPRFNGTNEQIKQFIEILNNGSKYEKYVIGEVLKKNNIPYINQKFLLENSANMTELQKVLQLVKDEREINRFIINNWAKEMNLAEGSSDYNNFMQKFLNEYSIINKIPINDLNVLKNIYKEKKYSYTKMDNMVGALKSGIGIHDLKRLDQLSEKINLSETQFNRYLNILLGKEGEDKKRVIQEMIRTNNIPYTSIRV